MTCEADGLGLTGDCAGFDEAFSPNEVVPWEFAGMPIPYDA